MTSTKNKADAVRELFGNAKVVECVENTYIPTQAGLRLEFTKVGKSVAEGIQLNGKHQGEPFYMSLPVRVRDVVGVSDTEATYLLDQKLERLKGHSVTYRIA